MRWLERVRVDGFAVTVSSRSDVDGTVSASQEWGRGELTISREDAANVPRLGGYVFNPRSDGRHDSVNLRFLSVPVLAEGGRVACALTLWGPGGSIPGDDVAAYVERMLEASREASRAVGAVSRGNGGGR